jgi:hypothetical protein
VLDAIGWVTDRNNRPVPTRGTPHIERSLQVVLADRAFTLMPIYACGTIRQVQVDMDKKQFLIVERSAFVLACSYMDTFLFYHEKVEVLPTGSLSSSTAIEMA